MRAKRDTRPCRPGGSPTQAPVCVPTDIRRDPLPSMSSPSDARGAGPAAHADAWPGSSVPRFAPPRPPVRLLACFATAHGHVARGQEIAGAAVGGSGPP